MSSKHYLLQEVLGTWKTKCG